MGRKYSSSPTSKLDYYLQIPKGNARWWQQLPSLKKMKKQNQWTVSQVGAGDSMGPLVTIAGTEADSRTQDHKGLTRHPLGLRPQGLPCPVPGESWTQRQWMLSGKLTRDPDSVPVLCTTCHLPDSGQAPECLQASVSSSVKGGSQYLPYMTLHINLLASCLVYSKCSINVSYGYQALVNSLYFPVSWMVGRISPQTCFCLVCVCVYMCAYMLATDSISSIAFGLCKALDFLGSVSLGS